PVLDFGRVGGTRGGAAIERDRRAVGAEPGLEADGGLGPVAAVAHFFLARPDQLHWLADRLADLDRLRDLIGTQPAAEPAAGERVVHVNVFRLPAGRARGELQRG